MANANKSINICRAMIVVLVLIYQIRIVLDVTETAVSSVANNDIIQTTHSIIQGEDFHLQKRPKIQKVALVKLKEIGNDIDIATVADADADADADTDVNSSKSKSKSNNDNNSLALEVESIHHIPDQRQVIVNLQQIKCRDPILFGRLSGAYVTLIDWEAKTTSTTTIDTTLHDAEHDDDDDDDDDDDTNHAHNQTTAAISTMLVGTYSLPSPGKYFIEVIGLFCNGPQWNATFQNDCMEDPTTHRLTEDTAFIDVVNVTDGTGDVDANADGNSGLDIDGHHGYWKRFDNYSNNDNNSDKNETTTTPLLTRYQPQQCRTEEDLQSDRCQVAMSLEQFAPYEFISTNDNTSESRIQSQLTKLQGEGDGDNDNDNDGKGKSKSPMLLCFIGLSHAREMSREVNLWLSKWNATSIVQSINIDAQFPRLVNPNTIQSKGCNASIIATGQWSAGRKPPGGRYRGLPPTTFDDYQTEVRDMILRLTAPESELKLDDSHKIYLRSIHYNALGDVKTTCPPEDWRSPPVIDTYNEIIKNLSSSMNISFIDTNFIVGPLWDISADFCHYRLDKVASAEALYMLGRLLLPSTES